MIGISPFSLGMVIMILRHTECEPHAKLSGP